MTEADNGDEFDTELRTVTELITDATPAILPGPDSAGWPYELEDGKRRDGPAPSQSTSAMIGYTLAALLGELHPADELAGPTMVVRDLDIPVHLVAEARRGYDCALTQLEALTVNTESTISSEHVKPTSEAISRVLVQLDDVLAKLEKLDDSRSRRARAGVHAAVDNLSDTSSFLTDSSLFGGDDPMTLDWMLRLCKSGGSKFRDARTFASLIARIRQLAKEKLANIRASGPEDFKLGKANRGTADDDFVVHVWPVVRIAYLVRNCQDIENLDTIEEILYHYFAEELAQQLGFAEVRDSSFDVARLVFALDGLTLCKPASLYSGLLHRSLEIIVNSHKVDPRLQPRRPFKVTPTGGVHIPITVEVFQSLIRILRRIRPKAEQLAGLQLLLPVLRRYTAYLQASIVDVRIIGETLAVRGWASDHEFSSSAKVETWFTSQVVVYLLMYGRLVREHAADVHLSDLKLQTRRVQRRIPAFFEDEEVLRAVADDFSLDNPTRRTRWSLLLYGPPGTGKTTIVEQIARKVDWPIVELSPSHFVDRGVDRVEERAAQLFRVLGHQNETVVLFDEIDRLVLDRSSEEYGKQGDMFQFMTPSMLTKLNDLRRREKVMFAIATNYAWRIDSAILRPGRIDGTYLILPPDAASRRKQIQNHFGDSLSSEHLAILVQGTVLASWTEIDAFCRRIGEDISDMSLDDARAACDELSPTIQLKNYDRELRSGHSGKPAEYLLRELVGLYQLMSEVTDQFKIPVTHAAFVSENRAVLGTSAGDESWAERLQQWLPGK